jgi:PleD family two-component response regulator
MSENTPSPLNREAAVIAPPITVLLIDDQPIVAAAVRRMLASEADMRVQHCQDPAQALGTAAALMPQVILLDLVMPGIDGLTLLKSFRGHIALGSIPIIVLSAKEDPKIKGEALDRGADDYMVKLPSQVELIARIRHHARHVDRISQQVKQQLRQAVQQLLEELQNNARSLQESLASGTPFALRDQAWRSLANQLNLPQELHAQVEGAYKKMQSAHQEAQNAKASSESRSQLTGIIETVKELAPLLTLLI